MIKEYVKDTVKLYELAALSTFTWEGMESNDANLKAIEKAIRERGFKKDEVTFYIWDGALMNKAYKLKGKRAYKTDLPFLGIKSFYHSMFKIETEARWLDDIVANNK